MKLATFNINNINRRLPNLLAWLKVRRPDVVCLQELKATDRQFPRTAIADAGYGAAFVGQSAWNGVAILARSADPVVTQTALPGDPDDDQARYIEAAVNGVVIGCLYAPNGNPQPGPKYDYKLRWMLRLHEHAAELLASKLPVVLAGDYNIVPPLVPPTPRCSNRVGPTRYGSSTPTIRRSTPSGTTCGTAGSGMAAFASTTSC
jgi:exodeoxyribonuclease-3